MIAMQLEFFEEEATAEEIKRTKSLLSKYRRRAAAVKEFERRGVEGLAPRQKETYNLYSKSIRDIESAVGLILDDEIRRIVEKKYIKGTSHTLTVMYFGTIDPSTVARKLNKGIESVANTLKLLGE
jgi:hypothetical protein